MTVPVPDQLEYISDADGVTKDFSYPKRFLQKDEIVVLLRDADGVDTPQIMNTHYTIAGSSWPSGGTISFINAPQAPNKVVRYRMTQAKQTVDLENNQRNDAPSVETQLDRLTMGLQDRGRIADIALSGLKAEIQERKAADAVLQQNINAEAAARAAADLQERNERIAGDAALAGSISNERLERIAADTKERAERIAADAREKLERIAGDLGVASLIGQAGAIEVPFYDTRVAASLAQIKPTINSIQTGGFTEPGDGGNALYKKTTSPKAFGTDIIQNGGFNADTNWNKGTGWSIAGGVAKKAITAAQSDLSQTCPLVSGEVYAVTYTIANYAGSGYVRPYLGFGGANSIGTQRTGNGTYTDYLVANPGVSRAVIQAQATVSCDIDNVSVRSLRGVFKSADGAWWELTKNPNGVSVIAFGADPIGTLDSTEAFNSCASFCATIGVPLLCPPGTYKLEANVTADGNIEWFVSEKAQFTGVGSLPSYGGANAGYRRPNETKHSVVVGTKTNPVTDTKSAFSATLYSAAPPSFGPKAAIVGYSELHSSANDAAVVGGFFEADDLVGWANSGGTGSNSYVEGARAHGMVRNSAPNGSAYGMVAAAMSGTASPKYLVAFEGGIHKYGGVDAPSPQFMDKGRLSVGFLASCHGTYRSDAAFMVNPWNDQKFAVGLHIPKGTVHNRAVYIDSDVDTAIDVAGTASFASVMVPNHSPIRGRSADNSLQYYLIGVTPENNIRIGQTEANAITIAIPGLGERAITYGAADSAGPGFRTLRIAN